MSDTANSRIALDPSFYFSSFLMLRQRIFSAKIHFLSLGHGRAQKICPLSTNLKHASEHSLDNFWFFCDFFEIVARILAIGFIVALVGLHFSERKLCKNFLFYPFDLVLWVSPQLSDQSAKTDLIDGDDHLEKQLNVLRTDTEVY